MRRPSRRIVRASIVSTLALLAASSGFWIIGAGASTAPLDLSVQPGRLLIHAVVGMDTATAAFQVESGEPLGIAVVASALLRSDENPEGTPAAPTTATIIACPADIACLDASLVAPDPASTDLTPGVPSVIVVSVSGFTRPGVYDGVVTLYSRIGPAATMVDATSSGAPDANQVMPIPLRVVVTAVPDLVLMPAADPLRVTRIRMEWVDAPLGWLFLDEAQRSNVILVPLANLTLDPLRVSVGVGLRGRNTSSVLPSGALIPVTNPVTLGPSSTDGLALDVSLGEARPDVYEGALYLAGPQDQPPQVIPFEITVRDGPFWPFVLIVIGVVLGLFVKWMLGTGAKLADTQEHFNHTASDLESASLTDRDRMELKKRLPKIRADLDRLDVETSAQALGQLDLAIKVLSELHSFEDDHPHKYADELRDVRSKAWAEDEIEAETALTAVRAKAYADSLKPAAGFGVRELAPANDPAGAPAGLGDGESPVATPPWWTGRRLRAQALVEYSVLVAVLVLVSLTLAVGTGVQGLTLEAGPSLVFLSLVGIAAVGAAIALVDALKKPVERFIYMHRAEAILRARWPLRIALMGGLVIVGMEVLYVNDAAAVLGARIDPFVQYLFWGIGTDVSSRTLANFAVSG